MIEGPQVGTTSTGAPTTNGENLISKGAEEGIGERKTFQVALLVTVPLTRSPTPLLAIMDLR